MVKLEYVPFYVHLNPISFGAWFIQYQDKPFIGPARTREQANKQLFASLSEGDLRIYLTNLRNAEITAIHAEIRANNELLVPFKLEQLKSVPLSAEAVSGHKPPLKPTNGPTFGAMAKLAPPKPKLPPSGTKAKPMPVASIPDYAIPF